MANYYEILGIDQSADSKQIKAAYKRLAMEYHPDRNPGNKHAEEVFKVVNEAYHTLSDPLKKSRHDASLKPAYSISGEEWIERNKRKYTNEKQYPHRGIRKYYRIDKEYYKIQGLAILAFIILAGFSFGILHTTQYFAEQKRREHFLANRNALKYAGTLFNDARFDDAFTTIHALSEKDPSEFLIHYTRDSLVSELRSMATKKYNTKDFASAITLYLTLQKYEQPVSMETIKKISLCQYYLGNYSESLRAMKHLHNQHPNSVELVYAIGMINLEKLENPAEALHYFTFGVNLYNENLNKIYGSTFETTMNPADAPDIYFDIFQGRAQSNIILNNFEEAVTDCNRAIHLRPMKGEPYKLRAIANTKIKRLDTVCRDIANAKRLGVSDVDAFEKQYCR
jgi:DnaJ domain